MLVDVLLRVYFSGRNERNVSHIGLAEIDLARPTEIQDYSREPVLLPGALGCFADNGVTPSSVVRHDGQIYHYYLGSNPGSTARMHLFGGLPVSTDGRRRFEPAARSPGIQYFRANHPLPQSTMVLTQQA